MSTRATTAQVDLIRLMIRSHVITDDEREKFNRALSEGMAKQRAKEAIEWLKDTIPQRKAAEQEVVHD